MPASSITQTAGARETLQATRTPGSTMQKHASVVIVEFTTAMTAIAKQRDSAFLTAAATEKPRPPSSSATSRATIALSRTLTTPVANNVARKPRKNPVVWNGASPGVHSATTRKVCATYTGSQRSVERPT